MKKCPYCAEEIQDEAIVCRYCQRDLSSALPQSAATPTPTSAPKKDRGCLVVVLVLVGLGVLMALVKLLGPDTSTPEQALLRVSAGRGPLGFSFTNNESSPLRQCDATIRNEGKEWFAVVPKRLEVSETAFVPWSDFTNAGQPMPGYLGRAVTVSCFVEGSHARQSASFLK